MRFWVDIFNAANGTARPEGPIITARGCRTIAAADLAVPVHIRDTAGGNRVDTTDTATNIRSALLLSNGASLEVLYGNIGAHTITIGAGTDVTLLNNEGASDLIIPAGGAARLVFVRLTDSVMHCYGTVFEAV